MMMMMTMMMISTFINSIILIQNHADPYIRNGRQESPLDLAAQYGRMETVSELSLLVLAKKALSILLKHF